MYGVTATSAWNPSLWWMHNSFRKFRNISKNDPLAMFKHQKLLLPPHQNFMSPSSIDRQSTGAALNTVQSLTLLAVVVRWVSPFLARPITWDNATATVAVSRCHTTYSSIWRASLTTVSARTLTSSFPCMTPERPSRSGRRTPLAHDRMSAMNTDQ